MLEAIQALKFAGLVRFLTTNLRITSAVCRKIRLGRPEERVSPVLEEEEGRKQVAVMAMDAAREGDLERLRFELPEVPKKRGMCRRVGWRVL